MAVRSALTGPANAPRRAILGRLPAHVNLCCGLQVFGSRFSDSQSFILRDSRHLKAVIRYFNHHRYGCFSIGRFCCVARTSRVMRP